MTKRYVHPSNDHKANAMRRMEAKRIGWERGQAERTIERSAEKATEETRLIEVIFDAKAA